MPYHKLMMENHTLFTKNVFERLEDLELTIGQPKILEYLIHHDGAVQKDIASACQIEPATVTSLLSRMEKKRLVERRMMNGDRRFLCTYLTDSGKVAAKYVMKAFADSEEVALEGFSKKEKEIFIKFLRKVNGNLKKVQGGF